VLCIPGPSLLDEAAAALVAQLVERQGIVARAEDAEALSISGISSWETKGVELICLCYVEHVTPAKIRYAIRRIRRRIPDVAIIVALFGNAAGFDPNEESDGAEVVQQSLREVVEQIKAQRTTKQEADSSSALPSRRASAG
jgi:hypothetical protein